MINEKSKGMRCLVVDDEFPARKLLSGYIDKIPFLELAGTAGSAIEAMGFLRDHPVDLLFLDIQMPDLTGIEFLRAMPKRPMVIMTTAYSEYALEGYELDVFDYLLKPIPFPRFMQAATKAMEQWQMSEGPLPTAEASPGDEAQLELVRKDYLTVKADHKIYKINFNDLYHIEGQREYVTFHTSSRKITAYYSLKKLEEQLPKSLFARVHKSFIVSINEIETLEGNVLEVAGTKIPVGKSYKEAVQAIFQND